jgi:hypothetical protein
VKDSVTYIWENDGFKIENKTLAKVIGSTKAEVGKYSQKTGRDKEGVSVVDTREVDELVVILTCIAVFQHKDSFSKGQACN